MAAAFAFDCDDETKAPSKYHACCTAHHHVSKYIYSKFHTTNTINNPICFLLHIYNTVICFNQVINVVILPAR